MASLEQVGLALRDAVRDALNVGNPPLPPCQVGLGFPFGPSVSEILGQAGAQCTIFPLKGGDQNRTGRKPSWKVSIQPPVTLLVDVNNLIATFSGVMQTGLNVHTFIGLPKHDVYLQTLEEESIPAFVARAASGINAAGYMGITASSVSGVLTVANANYLHVNIGGQATMVREVRRMMKPFQVSYWAASPGDRNLAGSLIDENVGVDFPSPFLQAVDGSAIWVRKRSDQWIDASQSSYSLYEYHAIYECEYPTLQSSQATQVEAIVETTGEIEQDGTVVDVSTEVIDGP